MATIFPRIKDLRPEQIKISNIVQQDIICRGKDYKLEIIACDEKLNEGSNIALFTAVAIYEENFQHYKIVFHEVFKQTLTKEDIESARENIMADPEKYIPE